MTLPVYKWELIEPERSIAISLELINTTPAPDTILMDWDVQEELPVFLEFSSLEDTDTNIFEARYFVTNIWAPGSWELINTTPAPDAIFMEFASFALPIIPIYPEARTLTPGEDLYAGDFGAYIG